MAKCPRCDYEYAEIVDKQEPNIFVGGGYTVYQCRPPGCGKRTVVRGRHVTDGLRF